MDSLVKQELLDTSDCTLIDCDVRGYHTYPSSWEESAQGEQNNES